MTALEKIDLILQETTVNISFKTLADKHSEILSQQELEQIFHKLKRDGYVLFSYPDFQSEFGTNMIEVNNVISLGNISIMRTFDGEMFSQSGGYTKQKENEDLNKKQIIDDLALRKRNDRHLVIGTFLVAAGAIGLIAWEVYRTFCLEHLHP